MLRQVPDYSPLTEDIGYHDLVQLHYNVHFLLCASPRVIYGLAYMCMQAADWRFFVICLVFDELIICWLRQWLVSGERGS